MKAIFQKKILREKSIKSKGCSVYTHPKIKTEKDMFNQIFGRLKTFP